MNQSTPPVLSHLTAFTYRNYSTFGFFAIIFFQFDTCFTLNPLSVSFK